MAAYAPIKGSDDENINVFAAARSKSSSRYSTQVNPVNTDDNDDVELALPSRSNHITSFSKSQPNPNIVAIENSKATSHSGDDNGGGGGGRNTSFVHRTNSTKQQQPQQKEGHQHQQQQQKKQQRRDGGRLVSLDVFRGLAVALMILVDDAGGLLPAINHSPWNGLTLADVVMPFFLFIVGVSLGLAYKKLSCKVVATRKAILRALKLLLLGLFLQGGYFHGLNDLSYGVNIEQMRWMGILQRIAAAYFVGAACEIWLKGDNHVRSEISFLRKYLFQWAVALGLIVTYLTSLYGLYVPDWRYQVPVDALSLAPKILQVKCDVRGDTSPACNAVGMIDRKILGIQHLYRKPIHARTKQCSMNSPDYGPMPPDAPSWCQAPFDPEGLLSSVMAIVTCLVGLHYGHIVLHFKDHKARIIRWMIPSTFLTVLGLALDFFGMRVNKALYSFSYMCVTAGAAGILFVGIYLLVDVCRYRRVTIVLEWMGNHALTIYVLAACNIIPVFLQGFYWKQPENNILRLIGIGR